MKDDRLVEMTHTQREGTYFRFSGHERILHRTSAHKGLPELMDWFGYSRAYIVCSRTLNTRTDVIRRLAAALGERCIGITDVVGEHSPLSNVLAGAREAHALDADVIVSVGGGSVMDMCKTMQLCISEQVFHDLGLSKLMGVVAVSDFPLSELRVCSSWSRSRHCRRWALGDGFTESPPRRSAPTCRPGRRRVIGHTGLPQFETPDPVSPWLQNLVTQRSPGEITVSSPREGLITCKSTPTVIPGVNAKL